ncbi:multifunctional CCA addition/repair protein [Derxia gummosa]|uniref:Multifunctional CCA addition/repair protein n=1 Tax=Derxia gummosa DSM 723 TaxID=1121388 RepID=A0AC36KKF3_9BURK|nr:multifunctional CCA addition/repair protein [Derxia gummosa]
MSVPRDPLTPPPAPGDAGPRVYQVGGSLRDELLGLPVQDRDWVVVGATPQQLLDMGFVAVGKDFPVFLHPVTHEEYALARTERKTAPGYHGFAIHASPEVTLDEDLLRRDLTINAIARGPYALSVERPLAKRAATGAGGFAPAGASAGVSPALTEVATSAIAPPAGPASAAELADPHGGRADIAARVFRHVSPAFAEDPVRILRLARFAARFTDFTVAPETLTLMRAMVAAGEVDALVPERVWQELSRGLMEKRPSRMFEVLRDCGALARLLPELDRLWGVPQRADYHPEVDTGVHAMMVIDMSARLGLPLDVRYAALLHDLGKGTTPADVLPRHIGHEQRSERMAEEVSRRLKVPTDCRDLARLVARDHGRFYKIDEMRAATVLDTLDACDAMRKPERFARVLDACECDRRGRLGWEDAGFPWREPWLAALTAARGVDAGAIAKEATARHAEHEARKAAQDAAAGQGARPVSTNAADAQSAADAPTSPAAKPARANPAEAIREAVRHARIAAVAAALGKPAH